MPTTYTSAADLANAIAAAAAVAPEILREPVTLCRLRELADDETIAAEFHDIPGQRWVYVHGPERPADMIEFHYLAGSTRGRLSLRNVRDSLLAMAEQVRANAAAFDGRAKSAPRPKRLAASSPYATACAMVADYDRADAARMVMQSCGPLFLGAGAKDLAYAIYANAEAVEVGGQRWVIGRTVERGGKWRILHERSGLHLARRNAASQPIDFRTRADALATLEQWIAEDDAAEYPRRIIEAAQKAPSFDQRAALLDLLGADDPAIPADAQTADSAHQTAHHDAPDAVDMPKPHPADDRAHGAESSPAPADMHAPAAADEIGAASMAAGCQSASQAANSAGHRPGTPPVPTSDEVPRLSRLPARHPACPDFRPAPPPVPRSGQAPRLSRRRHHPTSRATRFTTRAPTAPPGVAGRASLVAWAFRQAPPAA